MNKDLNREIDISVALPIWYGAKVEDVESCMDSIYDAIVKAKNSKSKIKVIVGIDNLPKDFDNKKPNNTKDLLERVETFKNALLEINKNIVFEYFVTEFNVKVSVMRNIMISKSQNAKYITFLDHDDQMEINAILSFENAIKKYYNENVKAIYFQFLMPSNKNDKSKFLAFAPWGELFDTEFLLKKRIAFIPNIQLEDRYFRREVEFYALAEEQINVPEVTYIHSKEQQSNNNLQEVKNLDPIRQELYKRAFFMKIKPISYITMRRGFDEIYYVDNSLKFETQDNVEVSGEEGCEKIFFLTNSGKHITKMEIDDFKRTILLLFHIQF
jgi:hypothetical protein